MEDVIAASRSSERKHPGELSLSLPAPVLRLPYPAATRLVLAEIVSIHAATNGNCYCSDAHMAARLTLAKDTVSRAVQHLVAEGLLAKHVDKAAGFHRTLLPILDAIIRKAATNPYPQNAGSPPTLNTQVVYPQNAGSPSLDMGVALPAKPDTNIPSNLPLTFHQSFNSLADKDLKGESFSEVKTLNALLEKKGKSSPTKRKARAEPLAELLTGPLAALLNPGNPAQRVQTMGEPLTQSQADALLADYDEAKVSDTMLSMANWSALRNKQSAALTARQWLQKGQSSKSTAIPDPVGPIKPGVSLPHLPTETGDLQPVIKEMAAIWTVTEHQGTSLNKLSRFVTYWAGQGSLPELGRQITAYGVLLRIRKLMPDNLDKFLGTESKGYQDGKWQDADWEAKAAKAAAFVSNVSISAAPVPSRASITPRPKTSWN